MQDSLQQLLKELNIHYTLHTHPAVFTVSEAKIHSGHIPGTHCKNLFLKNKKTGQLYLITIPYDKRLDMNQFRKNISAPKVRFVDDIELFRILGIKAGSVSPLALINDKEKKVIFIIEETVWNDDIICCHPNVNTETLQIPGSDFKTLMMAIGNRMHVEKLPYVKSVAT